MYMRECLCVFMGRSGHVHTSRRVPPTLPCPMTYVLLWWEEATSMVSIFLLGLEPYTPQGQIVTFGR